MLTDARFSGVSTGACIGHVGPEALAGGPVGKVRDGDLIRIVIDRNRLEGSVDLVGGRGDACSAPTRALACWLDGAAAGPARPIPTFPPTPASGPRLQNVSGGTWGGCVYDAEAIIAALDGRTAAARQGSDFPGEKG